jgi:hypothetical protein
VACSSNCRSGPHETYGACLRAKNLRTNALDGETLVVQKAADKTLDDYAKARSYGIQPKSTRARDVQAAIRVSDITGSAFQG